MRWCEHDHCADDVSVQIGSACGATKERRCGTYAVEGASDNDVGGVGVPPEWEGVLV